MRVSLAALFALCLGASPGASLAAVAPPPTVPATSIVGHWEGSIELPGKSLGIRVELASGAPGLFTGTIDIPEQGASALPLEDVSLAGDEVRFAIASVPGKPTFDGHLSGETLRGQFTQGQATLTFQLRRTAATASGTPHAPKTPNASAAPTGHPQEPKPPFPYRQREVVYEAGPVHLAGTLTLPAGPGPFPAVLLITGSGAQNRNEEILGQKPFLVIADHLTRAGIVVLRVDDRGVGGSSGNNDASTDEDFANDALAGVRTLAAQPEVAHDRIGLLGHSEGGLVAPLAASRSRDVAFLVLLAGPGLPGHEIIMSQTEWLVRQAGAPEEVVQRRLAIEQSILDLVRSDLDDETLRMRLRPLLQSGLDDASAEEKKSLGAADQAFIDKSLQTLTSRWLRSFVRLDPRPILQRVQVPVLALGGDKDFQVAAAKNLPAIEQALKSGGDRDVTTQLLPGLNHLFQHATTGGMEEYGVLAETISPAVLDIITHWILQRFGAKPAAAKTP